MTSAALSQAYQAARTHAALLARHRGRIVVSGRDRASYLQGLLTNDIPALKEGHGCYAAYLTPQGRLISDLLVYELGDVILLTLPLSTKDVVLAKLDQFIFSEDVQLGDVTDTFGSVVVAGPDAALAVNALIGTDVATLAALPVHGNLRGAASGQPVIVLRVDDTGEPGFELLVPAEALEAVRALLLEAGAVEADEATAEQLRIEAGVARFGVDMDEETIPLEAGIEARAISFTKGCYVGQEVIIRVLHRGHGRVARKLVGLAFDPAAVVPAPGTVLRADDKEIGSITSSAFSPAAGRPVALGYVKRDFIEPGTVVTTADGTPAQVTLLPFVARA
jgi:folate-binding protein YgfZ